jgi:hypothetical protein
MAEKYPVANCDRIQTQYPLPACSLYAPSAPRRALKLKAFQVKRRDSNSRSYATLSHALLRIGSVGPIHWRFAGRGYGRAGACAGIARIALHVRLSSAAGRRAVGCGAVGGGIGRASRQYVPVGVSARSVTSTIASLARVCATSGRVGSESRPSRLNRASHIVPRASPSFANCSNNSRISASGRSCLS